jgi:hypothetical protein
MALFMDFHEDLKLPAGAIAQIAEATRQTRADQFGVGQVELHHDPGGKVYCLPNGRTRTPSASITPRSACPAGRCTRCTA